MIEWHIKTFEEIERELSCDLSQGLSEKEAALRGAEKKNHVFPQKQKNISFYAKEMMIVLLPLMLLVTALALLLGDQSTEGYLLLGSSLFCIGCLFLAYNRARRILESAEEAAPSVRVFREGKRKIIPLEALVAGDILFLEKGDFVPADCRLLQSDSLLVRESGITAAKFARKDATVRANGDILASANMVWAGTAVESGSARAVVLLVGEDTHLAKSLSKKDEERFDSMPFLKRLQKVSLILSSSLLGLVFLSTLLGFFSLTSGSFLDSWTLIVAFAASALVDFYGVFAYITASFALYGVKGRRRALHGGFVFKHGKKLKTLSSIDRLFVTAAYFTLPFSKKVAYLSEPFGKGEAFSPTQSALARHLVRDAALALGEGQTRNAFDSINLTEEEYFWRLALAEALKKDKSAAEELAAYPLVGCGKTEKGVCYGMILRGNTLVVTLFAKAELLLPHCRYAYRDGKLIELDSLRRDRILQHEKNLATASEHTLRESYAVALGVLSHLPEEGVLCDAYLESTLSKSLAVEGYVTFEEELHQPSVAALKQAISEKVGVTLFCESEKDCLLASKLSLPIHRPSLLAKGQSGAFYRLSRREKLALVRAAKKNGESAACVGESFYDLAQMRQAELSFALGSWQLADESAEVSRLPKNKKEQENKLCLLANSCTALRYSTDLLVSPPRQVAEQSEKKESGGFASLFDSIRRAGSFYDNMRSVLCYLAFSASVKLFLSLASLFIASPLIAPWQLALLGLVFDPLLVLSLSVAPPALSFFAKREERQPLGKSVQDGLLGGLIGGALILALSLFVPMEATERLPFASLSLALLSLFAFWEGHFFLKQPFSRFGIAVSLSGAVLWVLLLVFQSGISLFTALYFLPLCLLYLILQTMLFLRKGKSANT